MDGRERGDVEKKLAITCVHSNVFGSVIMRQMKEQ